MALAPWKIRLTADTAGTLDEVRVRIELVDYRPVDPPEEGS